MRSMIEVTKVDLMDGEELMELAKKVMVAITQNKGKLNKSLGLVGIFKDHIVVRDFESGKMFRMEMKRDDGGNVLLEGLDEVKQVFVPIKPKAQKAAGEMQVVTLHDFDVLTEGGELSEDMVEMIKAAVSEMAKAQWTAAFINDLPDSSFLYIEPGGKKDDSGKTTPRGLRHFPIKDASGKVDLPHLRNALARIPQSNLPQAVKDKCIAEARKLFEAEQSKRKSSELDMEPTYLGVQVEAMWRGVLS